MDQPTPVYLFEDHCESYIHWKRAHLRNLTVIHVDAHLDLRDEELSPRVLNRILRCGDHVELESYRKNRDLEWDGFNPGNYLYPACLDGTVARLIWVIPPHLIKSQDILAWSQEELQKWKNLTIKEYNSWEKIGDTASGILAGIRCEICLLPHIGQLRFGADEIVVWDVDTDFLIDELDKSWISPKSLTASLRQVSPHPRMITIAYSVNGGYTPPEQKYLGSILAQVCRDFDDESGGKEFEAFRRGDTLRCERAFPEALGEYRVITSREFVPFVLLRMIGIQEEIGDSSGDEREVVVRMIREYLDSIAEVLQGDGGLGSHVDPGGEPDFIPEMLKGYIGKLDSSLLISPFTRGMNHFRRNEYTKAFACFAESGLREDSVFLSGAVAGAVLLMKRGDFTGSLRQWLCVLESESYANLDRQSRGYLLYLAGTTAFYADNLETALEILNRAADAYPGFPGIFLRRGLVRRGRGEFSEACRDFHTFLSHRPGHLESLEVHMVLAEIYALQGNHIFHAREIKKIRELDKGGLLISQKFRGNSIV